ncbi:unnamed protein product [Urochloa decumbens]|uniref:SIAH-type domain-containing protein n=1 Tax=Urochloa decumbens TaxID=240449 RepID=A0ABC8Z8Z9_9POAL
MSKRSGSAKRTKVSPAVPPPRSSPRNNPSAARKGDDEEAEEKNIWLDPDALSVDCGICFMPFEAEVFMCKNGHAACAKCCVRINRKCWCCDEPIGDVRCRPAESMLAEMNTVCKYSKYGCAEVIKYVEKRRHEESCPRAPYGCPVAGCTYRGMLLYSHVLDDHAGEVSSDPSPTCSRQRWRSARPRRSACWCRPGWAACSCCSTAGVSCRGAPFRWSASARAPRGDVEINYKMEVRGCEPGALSLAGTAPCVRVLEGFEPKKFLFVPDADWGPSGTVSVSIRIG